MNKKTFPLLLATAMVLGACSNDTLESGNVEVNPDEGKTAIDLGGVSNAEVTRAGFTEANTTLKLHYESTRKAYDAETFPYNDGEGKSTLYMTSSATAAMNASTDAAAVSSVSQTTGADGEKRYWDDVHGKNSEVSIYAIAVANKTTITKNATAFNAYDTKQKEGVAGPIAHTIAWAVSTDQTATTIADEDLVYSNNVSGVNKIGFQTGSKTFEVAEGDKALQFKHALSRVTINVVKGEAYGDFNTEFNITKADFKKQNSVGTLTVTDGSWNATTTNQTISMIGTSTDYMVDEVKQGYTFCAQVLPNVTLKNVDDEIFNFVVDGNNYPIKGDDVYKALIKDHSERESYVSSLKPGYNYKLTVTINKTPVQITEAKLVGWEEITGTEIIPSNAIALDLVAHPMEQSAGTQTSIASDIYRSTTLNSGYKANKNTLSAANVLGTPWYWPDNNTEYHLRTIYPQGTEVSNSTPASDHITMTGGAIASTQDYIWGAPLEEKHAENPHNFTYDTNNGYSAYLYLAIGATRTPIHITQFHMTSKIEVQLTTSDDDSKIDLSAATVKLVNHYTSGRLFLYNGSIDLSGSRNTTGEDITIVSRTTTTGDFTWRTIPQTLNTVGNLVTFEITANGNNYTVNLADVTVNETSNKITSWAPGQSYVYRFKITKSPIVISSAMLVDWNTITGTIKDITLEN